MHNYLQIHTIDKYIIQEYYYYFDRMKVQYIIQLYNIIQYTIIHYTTQYIYAKLVVLFDFFFITLAVLF